MPTTPTEASALPSLLLTGVNQRTGARGTFRLDHVRAVAMPTASVQLSSSESLRARARHISASGGAPQQQAQQQQQSLARSSNSAAVSNTIVGLEAFVRGVDLDDEPSSPKSSAARPIAAVAATSVAASTPSPSSPSRSPPRSPSRSRQLSESSSSSSPPPLKKPPRDRENRKTIIQRMSAVFTSKRETELSRVKKLIKRINKLFEQGKFDDALPLLKRILESPASDNFRTRALFNIALCHAALRQFDDALEAVRVALAAGYDAFQNLQHPFFSPLQDNPEFFSLLSVYLHKSDVTGAVLPIDQITEYDTAPRLSGTMMHEMLVSPDVEYEPIPCVDGTDDMDLADGDDNDELERADDDSAHAAGDADDDELDNDDDGDDDERLIDRRRLPPTPSAPPATKPPLDQELPQPVPPASEAMMKLSESANKLAAAGRAADARRVYMRMLELQPKNGAVYALWANLEAQVNDKHESCRLLKLAAQCGFSNWASIQRQAAFAPVMALPEFVEMMEELRGKAAAVHSETRLD